MRTAGRVTAGMGTIARVRAVGGARARAVGRTRAGAVGGGMRSRAVTRGSVRVAVRTSARWMRLILDVGGFSWLVDHSLNYSGQLLLAF